MDKESWEEIERTLTDAIFQLEEEKKKVRKEETTRITIGILYSCLLFALGIGFGLVVTLLILYSQGVWVP